MTIIHDLVAVYNSISVDRAFHSVIAALLKNLPQIPRMSLEETAELCNTSVITINRLLKEINCPSFRAFKQRVSDVINGYSKHNRVFPYDWQMPANDHDTAAQIANYFMYLQGNIQEMARRMDVSQIEMAADILYNAKDVHVYGMYPASHAKKQFQVDLMVSGKYYICYSKPADIREDIRTLGPESAVITQVIASYKDYSEIMPAINHVLELKIPTIVISSTKTLNNFKDARCVLTFPGTDTAMDNYFIDILFNLMCMIYRTNYIDGN